MIATYESFLETKRQLAEQSGFDPVWLPEFLFPFQRYLVEWAVRQGRAAIFADCGLGKTIQQLVWAENVLRKTNKPVLILTPLAVAQQTKREAAKFGLDSTFSQDGKHGGGLVITNYERLRHFESKDFAGVVCDECFPAGTKIDTPSGKYDIDTLCKGDKILNASGVDVVSSIQKREVQYAVAFTAGQRITTSPNHPVFTRRGWVCAQDLEPGDCVLQTTEAVRMLREDVSSASVSSLGANEILREILLSEMENEPTGARSEGSYAGSSREAGACQEALACVWIGEGTSGDRENSNAESDDEAGSSREGVGDIESHASRTFRTWRKRNGTDDSTGDYDGCARKWMGSRIEHIVGFQDSRLSDMLQGRLRQQRDASCYRGGWILPPQQEVTGREENCQAGFVRVDRLEILEQGHPELERLRAPDGKLYFYDIEATRHPSFSVAGLLVHNSSILKSFQGTRRKQITRFMAKMKYRLLCTATAAPNDYVELGTSSEALGELNYSEMLKMFFAQLDDKGQKREQKQQDQAEFLIATDPNYFKKLAYRVAQTIGQWRLKHHAVEAFWRWVASWSKACRMPSDLGFSDEGFILPELQEHDHIITPHSPPPGMLFNVPAFGMREERAERRRTLKQRCEFVAGLVDHDRPAVVWCQMNDEGDLLEQIIPGAEQIAGRTPDERKIELYEAFASGELKKLVTKSKIAGWGLNWQHCNHTVMFATHSYEQYYQSLRRFYRYGQKHPVRLDVVATEGEVRVLGNMRKKAEKSNVMFESLVREMQNATRVEREDIYTKPMKKPSWL